MKPYKVIVDVTYRWKVEIHAIDETEAQQVAEDSNPGDIEDTGDFCELRSVEAVDVEEILGEEDDW